jgi:REP element-mobilizing transposase RayT
MANTYTQIYVQIVFAVEGRQNLIPPNHRSELHKYITGIVRERGQKLLSIFAMPDHIHILIAVRPSIAISDLVRDIKTASTNFINRKGWIRGQFRWQEGFGAFSYSRSQIPAVSRYIENQEIRHQNRHFKSEYRTLLRRFDVDYDEKYLFTFYD